MPRQTRPSSGGNRRQGELITALAREQLGFDHLKPGQRQAVEGLISGRDTLVVMPTGSGKTAIYELAGAVLQRLVVVVSPLIALQRDQAEGLAETELGAARELNSTMPTGIREQTLADLAAGRLRFLLVAPEQLANPEILAAVASASPALFVVDEAHCVTSWGHDFRPDYLHLASAAEAMGRPPILALTATAAPPVRQAIVSALGMEDPEVIVEGFDRPNIFLSVRHHHDPARKHQDFLDWISGRGEGRVGIVYVATRRETDDLAREIGELGLRAGAYHGGLAAKKRDRIQAAFMTDELDVVVATTAFGMGIDKPNVAFVAHYEPSDSLDSYYQEIGRSGRDGSPAEAVLFYRVEDLGLRRFFAAGGEIDEEELTAAAAAVAGQRDATADDVASLSGLSITHAERALNRLVEVGAAERTAGGGFAAAGRLAEDSEADWAAARAVDAQRSFRLFQQSRVEMMRTYAESQSCRREVILTYFGEDFHGPCNCCDNCLGHGGGEADRAAEHPFPTGTRVAHPEWGPGQIIRTEGDQLTVLFERVGYKTLSLPLVLERRLLEPRQA